MRLVHAAVDVAWWHAGGRAKFVREQSAQFRRKKFRIAAQTRTGIGIEQHGNLVGRLLANVESFRKSSRVKIDWLPRVDAYTIENFRGSNLRA